MTPFKVTSIIDGDTFEVSPQWKWNGQGGTRVRPTGFDTPELQSLAGQVAKERLTRLILSKQVELGTAYKVDRGRVVCDVYLNGRNLAEFFPGYQ